MSTLLQQLEAAKGDITRVSGELTTLRESLAQVPGGDLPAMLSEYTRRGSEITRLSAELTTLTGRASAAESEVTSLRDQLARVRKGDDVEELAENRAAAIVAATGVTPAAAETAGVTSVSSEPANFEAFQAEYSRLHGESSGKASAYYAQWGKKFNL